MAVVAPVGEAARLTGPYPGLAPYTEASTRFFFGRAHERDVIVANVIGTRLTLLYGPSGVGKTSLLRAGVVGVLRERAWARRSETGSPEFVPVYFNAWRSDPRGPLADEIARAAEPFRPENAPAPSLELPLERALQAWADTVDADLVLILDQFEEYFVYHPHDDLGEPFAAELVQALDRTDLDASFLLSIREDAAPKVDRFKGAIPALWDNYLRIDRLDRRSAREAIVEPLAEYNRLQPAGARQVDAEEELVDRVLDEVRASAVAIASAGRGAVDAATADGPEGAELIEAPFLQLVMERLWQAEEEAGSDTLRAGTLTRLGGARDLVRAHLDTALDALSVDEQDVAARMFHHLVTPGGSKIAHTLADLAGYAGVPPEQLRHVAEFLADPDRRVLRPLPPAPGQTEPSYEILHDVLAGAVLDWRTRLLARREVEQAALAERERHERERRRFRFRVALAFALGALVAVALGGIALYIRGERDKALAQELAAKALITLSSRPTTALELALESLDHRRTREGEDVLRATLATPAFDHLQRVFPAVRGGALEGIAFSPDGRFLVTAGAGGQAAVWRTEGAKDPVTRLAGHDGAVVSAAFSRDGRRIVTGGDDGTARIWDAATGTSLRELRGHQGSVRAASFSPDGTRVLTVSVDLTARLWDAETGMKLDELAHDRRLEDVAFAPDGRTAGLVGADGTVLLWMLKSRRVVALQGHADSVRSIAFDRTGRVLATAGDDGIRLWRLADRFALASFSSGVAVQQISFDSGQRVVAAGGDGSVLVWDVRRPRKPLGLALVRDHPGELADARFSPDGGLVATASSDGRARLFEARAFERVFDVRTDAGASVALSGSRVLVARLGHPGEARVLDLVRGHELTTFSAPDGIQAVALSPSGDRVFTSDLLGRVQLWRLGVRTPRTLEDQTSVVDIAVSPDGRLLASVGSDPEVVVRRARDGRIVRELRGAQGSIRAVAFSSDGALVAAVSEDGAAWIWATAGDAGPVVSIRSRARFLDVAFSPDASTIVVAGSAGAQIRDRERGELITQFGGAAGGVTSAQFDISGELVLTGGADGVARVWNAKTGREIVRRSHSRFPLIAAVFGAGRSEFLAAGSDGAVRLYSCSVCRPLEVLVEAARELAR